MNKLKSLVLEGGGMRGAYTAGALTWLIDNNIEFDNAYGISTGAIHLCNFLLKDKKLLFDFSTKYITDKKAIGIRALFRCGHVVDYDYLFNEVIEKQTCFDIKALNTTNSSGNVGIYELENENPILLNSEESKKHKITEKVKLELIDNILKLKADINKKNINEAAKNINIAFTKQFSKMEESDVSLLPKGFDKKNPDCMILSVALKYKNDNPILLTSDFMLQSRASGLGITTISLEEFLR